MAFSLLSMFMFNPSESKASEIDRKKYEELYLRDLSKRFSRAFRANGKSLHAKVSCKVNIGAEKATEIKIEQSSGDLKFDNAATKAASTWIRPSQYAFNVITDFAITGVKSELSPKK